MQSSGIRSSLSLRDIICFGLLFITLSFSNFKTHLIFNKRKGLKELNVLNFKDTNNRIELVKKKTKCLRVLVLIILLDKSIL